jgi:hypothetical protein
MQSNNPNCSNEGSNITIGFPNVIHTTKTIKQNYLGISTIPFDRFRVI